LPNLICDFGGNFKAQHATASAEGPRAMCSPSTCYMSLYVNYISHTECVNHLKRQFTSNTNPQVLSYSLDGLIRQVGRAAFSYNTNNLDQHHLSLWPLLTSRLLGLRMSSDLRKCANHAFYYLFKSTRPLRTDKFFILDSYASVPAQALIKSGGESIPFNIFGFNVAYATMWVWPLSRSSSALTALLLVDSITVCCSRRFSLLPPLSIVSSGFNASSTRKTDDATPLEDTNGNDDVRCSSEKYPILIHLLQECRVTWGRKNSLCSCVLSNRLSAQSTLIGVCCPNFNVPNNNINSLFIYGYHRNMLASFIHPSMQLTRTRGQDRF
jgi:hypothetical protein